MGEVREGRVSECVKKKHKKRNVSRNVGTEEEEVGQVGSVEKKIVYEGTEEVQYVKKKKKKKQKEVDCGVSEKEEHVKDKKQKKKDIHEVTENVEPAGGKKKKKKMEKDVCVGLSGEKLSNRCLVLPERKEMNEAVGRTDLGEDQMNNGIVKDGKSVENIKRPKKNKGDLGAGSVEKEPMDTTNATSISDGQSATDKASKKRKQKSNAVNTEKNSDAGASVSDEANELTEPSEKSNLKKKPRKVKFADSVEVFSLSDNTGEGEENIVDSGNSSKVKKELVDGGKENLVGGGPSSKGMQKLKDGNIKKNSDDGLVQGKRFSKKEDEMIRNAVLQYVEDHRLGEDGVKMVMKCGRHRDKIKDCWKEIAEALPWRHKDAVYSRAYILFERSENHTWTKEELEEVRKYHEKYGPKWRELADEIGRNRIHVKDAFRQVRLPNKKTGQWSQEEYQTLFNLVNKDLRMRAFMDKKSKHGMLRDNIGWEAISDKLSTRTDPVCCQKWYAQLTSSLVVDGKWADADDYWLLMALVDLDATCEEDVDWDYLLEHRSGDVCRKRWNEMVRHIGEHGNKSFSEQVEILSQRYCPDLLEAREAYDNKPFVDA